MGAFDDLIPGGGAKAPTATQAQAMKQRANNLLALGRQFADVRDRYKRDLAGGPGPSSLLEYLPLPRNKAFDSSAAGLSDMALAAFRVPGVGAQSDRELASFVAANQPMASDSDEQIEAKLGNLRNRLTANGVQIPGETGGFRVIRRNAK